MSLSINAWLENGEPHLQILDAESERVCLSWRLSHEQETSCGKEALQKLFRELILLSVKQGATAIK